MTERLVAVFQTQPKSKNLVLQKNVYTTLWNLSRMTHNYAGNYRKAIAVSVIANSYQSSWLSYKSKLYGSLAYFEILFRGIKWLQFRFDFADIWRQLRSVIRQQRQPESRSDHQLSFKNLKYRSNLKPVRSKQSAGRRTVTVRARSKHS